MTTTASPHTRALRSILAQLGPPAGSTNVVELSTGHGYLTVHVAPGRGRTGIAIDLICDERPRPAGLAQLVEDIAARHGATGRGVSSNYLSLSVRSEVAPLAVLDLLAVVDVLEQVQP